MSEPEYVNGEEVYAYYAGKPLTRWERRFPKGSDGHSLKITAHDCERMTLTGILDGEDKRTLPYSQETRFHYEGMVLHHPEVCEVIEVGMVAEF